MLWIVGMGSVVLPGRHSCTMLLTAYDEMRTATRPAMELRTLS